MLCGLKTSQMFIQKMLKYALTNNLYTFYYMYILQGDQLNVRYLLKFLKKNNK